MSDLSDQTTPPAPPADHGLEGPDPAPVVDDGQPSREDLQAELEILRAQIAKEQADRAVAAYELDAKDHPLPANVPAADVPAAAPADVPAAAPAGRVAKGGFATFSYEDPLDGVRSQHGVVLDVTEDGLATVAWFAGVSGPLPVDDLEPLGD